MPDLNSLDATSAATSGEIARRHCCPRGFSPVLLFALITSAALPATNAGAAVANAQFSANEFRVSEAVAIARIGLLRRGLFNEAVIRKRTSGRAQQRIGPYSRVFRCVANTVGQPRDGRQSSRGQSFIREPNGMPLAEVGWYQEEMISAVLDLARADRSYVRDSLDAPPFLRKHWKAMLREVKARADLKPR